MLKLGQRMKGGLPIQCPRVNLLGEFPPVAIGVLHPPVVAVGVFGTATLKSLIPRCRGTPCQSVCPSGRAARLLPETILCVRPMLAVRPVLARRLRRGRFNQPRQDVQLQRSTAFLHRGTAFLLRCSSTSSTTDMKLAMAQTSRPNRPRTECTATAAKDNGKQPNSSVRV